jgi:hypothetical protein
MFLSGLKKINHYIFGLGSQCVECNLIRKINVSLFPVPCSQ